MPLLTERLLVNDPHVRRFLVGWIQVVDSVPGVDLVPHCPKLLQGLLEILADPNPATQPACESLLGELLDEVRTAGAASLDLGTTVGVLVRFALAADVHSKAVAVHWLAELCLLARGRILPYVAAIAPVVLVALEHTVDSKLRELARTTNQHLLRIVTDFNAGLEGSATGSKERPGFDLTEMLLALTQLLDHTSSAARIEALRWVLALHVRMPGQLRKHLDDLLVALTASLDIDADDEVLRLTIEVLAEISEPEEQGAPFANFVQQLLGTLRDRPALFTGRGTFIVQTLLRLINPVQVLSTMATLLVDEGNLTFVAAMVDVLDRILLHEPELADLRYGLRKLGGTGAGTVDTAFFRRLFVPWCASVVGVMTLGLLAEEYQLVWRLLDVFRVHEIDTATIQRVKDLIQALESAAFSRLRLQLLTPHKHPYLVLVLFGLTMLVPQDDHGAVSLRKRLTCMKGIHMGGAPLGSGPRSAGNLNASETEALVQHFFDVQRIVRRDGILFAASLAER